MTPEQENMLRAIHQLLLGYNKSPGLVADFENHKKQDALFRAKFYAFRLSMIVAFTALVGGSGFGLAKVLELLR